jgi:hypothetical protein
MVDHAGLPKCLKLSFKTYDTKMTIASGSDRDLNDKKLTKVLSTKLSVVDYDRFVKYTHYAYKARLIDEPKTSKYLRLIVTYPFNVLGLH